MYIIQLYGPNGTFHHAIIEYDLEAAEKHFSLLKETRNAKTIPLMTLSEIVSVKRIDTHTKRVD